MADRIWRGGGRRQQKDGMAGQVDDGFRQENQRHFVGILTAEHRLRLGPKTAGPGELHNMIGIGGACGLREDRQRPRHGMMLMAGATGLVMQHQPQPARAGSNEGLMVCIQHSQPGHPRNAQRREQGKVKAQQAASRDPAARDNLAVGALSHCHLFRARSLAPATSWAGPLVLWPKISSRN